MKETIPTKHINTITAVLVGTTLLAGAVQSGALFGDVNAATRNRLEATATVAVSAACSLTGEVTSEHTATLVPGVYSGAYETDGLTPYANGIGSTTLTAICNDNGGFAIYAVGGSLKEGTIGATNLVGAGTGQTIATGTATSGNTSNWAMKLAKVTNSYLPDNLTIVNNFDSFHTIPANYTRVARYDSTTDNNQGSQMTTTYAAYIQPAQAADVYVGHVTYALVHPSSAMPVDYTMQNIAEWKDTLLPNEEVEAYDIRDGKRYTVALLDDGNVWMTQNLDLQIGGYYNGDPVVLTSENTDLHAYQTTGGATFTDYSYNNGLITWAPTVANTNATVTGTPAYITTDNGTTVAGWTDDNNKPYLMEGGDTYSVQGTRFNSLSACEANGTRTEAQCMHYHVGNYYNFSAAVAMSNTSSYNADKTVMPNSICPSGWRLPNGLTSDGTNTVQSDFNKLLTEYGIANGTDLTGDVNVGWKTNGFTNIGLAPLFFVRSGGVRGTTLFEFGLNGVYWSSTVNSASYGYYLYYNSNVLSPANRYDRGYGRSVRCIAR